MQQFHIKSREHYCTPLMLCICLTFNTNEMLYFYSLQIRKIPCYRLVFINVESQANNSFNWKLKNSFEKNKKFQHKLKAPSHREAKFCITK